MRTKVWIFTEFSMDLYPFYPPLVKVIRPRLQRSMMTRVTTMEILKLTYWDPARDMKTVLMDIKRFLAAQARLDLNSGRNDKEKYPAGAYIDIEHHLLRLALVSEVTPRVSKKHVTEEPAFKMPDPSKMIAISPTELQKEELLNERRDNVFMFQDLEDVNIESDTSEEEEEEGEDGSIIWLDNIPPLKDVNMESAEPKEEVEGDIIKQAFLSKPLPSEDPKPSGSGLPLPKLPKDSDSKPNPASGEAGSVPPSQMEAQQQRKNLLLQNLKKLKTFKKMKGGASNSGAKYKPDGAKTLAKGIGYSSYSQKGWDVKAWQAAQREKDKQIMMVLEKILEELKKFHRMTMVKTRNLPDLLFEAAGSGAGGSGLPSVEAVDDEQASSRGHKRLRKSSPDKAPVDPISDLYAILESSALVPFLESRLQNSSFLEICRHTAVFKVEKL